MPLPCPRCAPLALFLVLAGLIVAGAADRGGGLVVDTPAVIHGVARKRLTIRDPERATFAPCHGAHRVTCVVDGDTIWYQREKIRIADINAPELERPECAHEAQLAAAATARLIVLLNADGFTLAPWPARRIDRYGRSLYIIERDGRSLGLELVDEGLAERWKGYRGSWC